MRNGVETFRKAFPQARSLWLVRISKDGQGPGSIEAFALGTTIVLVQDYGSGDGWNAFTPTTDEGRIDATLQAIGERAGVVPVLAVQE